MSYKHTQIGYFIIFALLVPIVLILLISFYTMWIPATIIVAVILFVFLLLFYSLTVKIKNHMLELVFGIGIIRKKIRLDDETTITGISLFK